MRAVFGLTIDALGLSISVYVTPADMHSTL